MSDPRHRRQFPKTASELMKELERDPMFTARTKQKEELSRQNQQRYRAAAHGVLEDLASLGFAVNAVGELLQLGRPYPEAVHVLARWLPRVDYAPLREDIVRALSVPWAKGTAPVLVSEFESADDESGLRWIVGNALEVLASDDIADELLRLATTSAYGEARQMVVLGLAKLKDPRAPDVLITLLADEDVVGHAVIALGRLRAKAARPFIEPCLNHPSAWIRREAKKAIAQIDGDTDGG